MIHTKKNMVSEKLDCSFQEFFPSVNDLQFHFEYYRKGLQLRQFLLCCCFPMCNKEGSPESAGKQYPWKKYLQMSCCLSSKERTGCMCPNLPSKIKTNAFLSHVIKSTA